MREHHAVFLLLVGVMVLMVVGGLFPIWRWPARLGPQPIRKAASPPYGWVVPLGGKTAFSFVGKRGVLSCGCFLLAQLGPQPSRWRLRRLTDGAYPLRVNPLFLLLSKRKSGSGLRKRKDRPVEIMGRYDTTGRWICAVMVSLGQKTLGYPSVSGGLRLSDLWSLLRHCR